MHGTDARPRPPHVHSIVPVLRHPSAFCDTSVFLTFALDSAFSFSSSFCCARTPHHSRSLCSPLPCTYTAYLLTYVPTFSFSLRIFRHFVRPPSISDTDIFLSYPCSQTFDTTHVHTTALTKPAFYLFLLRFLLVVHLSPTYRTYFVFYFLGRSQL
jgi:hypothetical protein